MPRDRWRVGGRQGLYHLSQGGQSGADRSIQPQNQDIGRREARGTHDAGVRQAIKPPTTCTAPPSRMIPKDRAFSGYYSMKIR